MGTLAEPKRCTTVPWIASPKLPRTRVLAPSSRDPSPTCSEELVELSCSSSTPRLKLTSSAEHAGVLPPQLDSPTMLVVEHLLALLNLREPKTGFWTSCLA